MLFAHLRNIGPITHFVPSPEAGVYDCRGGPDVPSF